MTQPAPQIGDPVIEILVPQGHADLVLIDLDIRTIAHEFTEFYSVNATHYVYDVLDTPANRRDLTAIILRWPGTEVRYGHCRQDPDEIREIIYTESGGAA